MDKLTAIKIKYDDGTYSDEIPVSVLSENVEWDNTHTLVDVLGSIDVDVTGTIQDQISQLFNEKVSSSELNNYVANQLKTDVTDWLSTNVDPVGSAVIVDSSLTIQGAAADAKVVGNLKSALTYSNKLSFADKVDATTEVIAVQFSKTIKNGVEFNTDANGAIHIKGTATSDVYGYRISGTFTTDNIGIALRIVSDGNTAPQDAIVGLYDGSTAYDQTAFPRSGYLQNTMQYKGTKKTMFVFIYIRKNTTVDAVITFSTMAYKGYPLAPDSKVISRGVTLSDGSKAYTGGDGNFLIDTGINNKMLYSMPYISDFSESDIDFENGTITFRSNQIALFSNGYVFLPNATVNYPVNGVQYIVYHEDTKTFSVHEGSYTGVGGIVLMAIWQKRVFSPYGPQYKLEHPAFPIKGELIAGAVINIDTINQTLSITNCVFMLGQYFVNKGSYNTAFTYQPSYAHFVYYDGTYIKVKAETPTSGYNQAFQEGMIPLFYFYFGRVYGLNKETKCYIDGVLINGASASGIDSQLQNKKIAFLGDSLTEGVGAGGNSGAYPKWIADKIGCNSVNVGLSGSAITVVSGQTVQGFIERVSTIPTDCSIVAFMGGTNDYWQNVPLGQDGDSTSGTFYGALALLCEALQTRFPTALIYAVVPPMGYAPNNNFDMGQKSRIGSFEDVATAIKTVCKKYAIPVIDFMHESSLNPKNSDTASTYYSDGVHLKSTGQKILASSHIGFLRTHNRLTW